MSCSCVYVDVSEPFDDWGKAIKVAGVEHECCECEREIAVGEEYEAAWGKWGDRWGNTKQTYETCIDCLSVRWSFFCAGFSYEGMWDYMETHVEDNVLYGDGILSDCLVPLTKTARDRVCDMIEAAWGRDDEE